MVIFTFDESVVVTPEPPFADSSTGDKQRPRGFMWTPRDEYRVPVSCGAVNNRAEFASTYYSVGAYLVVTSFQTYRKGSKRMIMQRTLVIIFEKLM